MSFVRNPLAEPGLSESPAPALGEHSDVMPYRGYFLVLCIVLVLHSLTISLLGQMLDLPSRK